jgi:amidase
MMSADMTDELWRWPAGALAEAIRTREISSAEAVRASLERIAAINPQVNALVALDEGAALDAAAAADRALAAGEAVGPLHGVPMAIKDNVEQAGRANTGGIVAAAGAIAEQDAPVVRNLRAAGAVFVARSNVPAFSLRWVTENDLHGRTLNPWDAGVTPGGSSGGAASAVATGLVPLAHGNDIAGSIRYPAFACGVAGLRPTVGRVPSWAPTREMPGLPYAVGTMAVEGPIARTVADLRLGLAAMEPMDLADPSCTGAPIPLDTPLPDDVSIGVVRDVGLSAPSPEVVRAIDDAAAALRDAGATVEEIEAPQLAEAFRLWNLLAIEDLRALLPTVEQLGDAGVKASLASHYAVAAELWGTPDLATVLQGMARRNALIHEVELLCRRHTALLLPTSAVPPPPYGTDATVDTMRTWVHWQWPSFTAPLLGLPAIAVPTVHGDGLPEGVQLLGGRFREGWLLELGQAIEDRAHTHGPIDPRTAS